MLSGLLAQTHVERYITCRCGCTCTSFDLKLKHTKWGRGAYSHHKFCVAASLQSTLQQAKQKRTITALTKEESGILSSSAAKYIIILFWCSGNLWKWGVEMENVVVYLVCTCLISDWEFYTARLSCRFYCTCETWKMSLAMHISHCFFLSQRARTVSTFLQSKLWK